MNEPKPCTRCSAERETMALLYSPPGGHSWFAPGNSDFKSRPPTVEHVCGACLTDDEIARPLHPVVAFVLGTFIDRTNDPEWLRSLEMVRAMFMVLNVDADNGNRAAALRALGLTK